MGEKGSPSRMLSPKSRLFTETDELPRGSGGGVSGRVSGGAGARPGHPQAPTFKEHVSMTSVCPQHVRFRNCLAIQAGTRSFSRGEQTFA